MQVQRDEFGGVVADRDEFGGDVPTKHSDLPTAAERPPRHYDFDPSIAAARTGMGPFADLAERFNRQRLNLQAGTVPFSEEIRAGLQALPEATMNWFRGGDFDFSKRYTPIHEQLESAAELRGVQNPVASKVENVLGGVAGALGAGQAGLTLAGRTAPQILTKLAPKTIKAVTPYVAAGTESGLYGTVHAAGAAKPGERLKAAAEAAPASILAGVAGETTVRGLSALDDIFTKRVPVPTGVTSETIAQQGSNFYNRARAEGVRYHPDAVQRLQVNARLAAEELDPALRPNTTSIVNSILKRDPSSMGFEEFHRIQKRISKALRSKNISPEDEEFLGRVRDATDSWAKSINPAKDMAGDFGGDPLKAYAYKKAGDQLWVKHKKLEFLEDLEELAMIKGRGHLTQSGVANAIKQLTQAEAKKIIAGKASAPWNKSESEQIKQMASGDSSSGSIKLLSRFALRGPVATMAGSVAGGQLLGWLTSQLGMPAVVAHAAPVVAGSIAAQKADQNALDALEAVRQSVTGVKPVPRPAPPPVPSLGTAGLAGLGSEQSRRRGPR